MAGERKPDEDIDESMGGNKVRDCFKNPRARSLAIRALKVSHGFIGTPILECEDIYADIKGHNPETGVSEMSNPYSDISN